MMIINPYAFGGAPLWTPASLTVPPSIWLNDTSAVTGTTNASQWNDISGNGYHFSQSTAALQPAINAAGLDGKRTIQSDGADDNLNNTSAGAKALVQNQTAAWALLVNKCADASAVVRDLLFFSTATSSNARFAVATSTTAGLRRAALRVRRLDGDAIATLSLASALDTSPHVLLFTMDWSAGDGTIYLDGAQNAQNLALTTSGSTSNTAPGSIVTLYDSAGASGRSASDCAEIIFGVGALPNSTEIEKLFGYAHHKWGLESLLPALHPYKASPP